MTSKPQKMPKVAKVKDKSPAELQITAEQLLREAKERELEIVPPPPRQKISDPEELQEYRLKKRRAFEDNIRKNRGNISNWIKYTKWEEEQQEIRRARSVYERALDVDHRNITLWLKYAEMEMRSRQVNHARNVWDRAVTILPRANQFWYKYTYMEEMLKNIAGSRMVFERWMEWEPDEQAWLTYIKFELRYKELDRARQIYERFVYVHPEPKYWIKYARFEENHGYIQSARRVYERAIEFYGDDHFDESLFIAFSKFEEGQKEHDRARAIYRYALDHMPKEKCLTLYNEYTRHEKKYGDKSSIDDVITSKRKFQYEEAVTANPNDYDTWFDYVRMLEADGNVDLIRETYERAIACVPPVKEKRYWRRYVYLWIYYGIFEELTTKDAERGRQVYQMCLRIIPHKVFTFAEIWLLYAKFEIRQKELGIARKYLGQALGMCPKHKLFRGYIDLEIKLREFDRCRKLYEKWAEFDPENCKMWIQFATLEAMLNDDERARGIYELAISQPRLDMPEYLWKSYIDYEVEQEEWGRVRNLYERLLERTHHVKVWISYGKCEHSMPADDNVQRARKVFTKANHALRTCQEKEQRLMLLEAWKDFEDEFGDGESLERVKRLMPRKVTRRRQVTSEDGAQTRWEEFVDYIFPDDESAKPSLLLLAKAKEWVKKQQEDKETEENVIKMEKEGYEENAPVDPDLDRDDSDVEIGSTSSDSSSESEDESPLSKKKRLMKMDKSSNNEPEMKRKKKGNSESSDSSSSSSDEDDRKMEKLEKSAATLNEEGKSFSSIIEEKLRKARNRSRSSSSSSSSDSDADKKVSRKRSSSDNDSDKNVGRKRSGSDRDSEKKTRRKSSSDSDSDKKVRRKHTGNDRDSDKKARRESSNRDSDKKARRESSNRDSDKKARRESSSSDSDTDKKTRRRRSSSSDSNSDRKSTRKSSSSDSDSDRKASRKRSSSDSDSDKKASRKRSSSDSDSDQKASRKRSSSDSDSDQKIRRKRSSSDNDHDKKVRRKRSSNDRESDRRDRKKRSSSSDDSKKPLSYRRKRSQSNSSDDSKKPLSYRRKRSQSNSSDDSKKPLSYRRRRSQSNSSDDRRKRSKKRDTSSSSSSDSD